jgi:hypothetical protein
MKAQNAAAGLGSTEWAAGIVGKESKAMGATASEAGHIQQGRVRGRMGQLRVKSMRKGGMKRGQCLRHEGTGMKGGGGGERQACSKQGC